MPLKKHEIIAAVIDSRGKITEVARVLGCSPRAIYDHRDKDPDIAEAIADARESHDTELLDTAETKLREHIEEGKPWAIKFVLSTLGKGRGYTEKKEIDHGGAKQIIMYMDLSEDEDELKDEALELIGREADGN